MLLFAGCRLAVDFTDPSDTHPSDTDPPATVELEGADGVGPLATEGDLVVGAVPGQGRVLVWEVPGALPIAEHTGPVGFGASLALRDGLLAVGSPEEGRVHVLDVRTGEERFVVGSADRLGGSVAFGDFDGGGLDLVIGSTDAGEVLIVDADSVGVVDPDLLATARAQGLGVAVLLTDLVGDGLDELFACSSEACFGVEGDEDGLDEPLIDDLADWTLDITIRARPDALAAGRVDGEPVVWLAREVDVRAYRWSSEGPDEQELTDATAVEALEGAALSSSTGLVAGSDGVWCSPGAGEALGGPWLAAGGASVASDRWIATVDGSRILVVPSCL